MLLRLHCRQTVVKRARRKPRFLKLLTFHLQMGTKKESRRADSNRSDLLITSELLKSRESEPGCFSLLLVSQHSIHCHPLETYILRAVGQ
jgi:hypothetical protein